MGVNVNLNNGQPTPGNRALSIIWIVAAGLGIVFGGLLIGTLTPVIFPTQGSAEAVQVDNLFRFMLVIGGAIFLLVIGVLLFSIFAFRAKPDDRADGIPIHGNTTLELTWTIIPIIIVAVLTIYAYQVWVSIRTVQPTHHDVGVVGQRFAWTFNYNVTPDNLPVGVTMDQLPADSQTALQQDGKMQFSSPQLAAWVGQQVYLTMHTEDVNHALWIPAMRIKQDLLAGRETSIFFTPIEAGTYRIECAELCGSGHGYMAGTIVNVGDKQELQGAWLIVYPDEETYLREFFDPQAKSVLFPPEDPVARGRQILASGKYPCATCHSLSDLNWTGNIGPNLNNVGNRAGNRISGVSAEDYIHNSVRHPADFLVPGYGALMPQFNSDPGASNYMPEDDLQSIIAYLLTQKQ